MTVPHKTVATVRQLEVLHRCEKHLGPQLDSLRKKLPRTRVLRQGRSLDCTSLWEVVYEEPYPFRNPFGQELCSRGERRVFVDADQARAGALTVANGLPSSVST